jgi:hypothetical protein
LIYDVYIRILKGVFMVQDKNAMIGLALLIVGLIVGLVAGYFLFGASVKPAVVGLSDADKNFLINVANAQIDLTTRLTALQQVQAVGLDWCTANNGQWQYVTQQGTLQVTPEKASELIKQGFVVRQTQDGNYLAQVTLINQAACIMLSPNKT